MLANTSIFLHGAVHVGEYFRRLVFRDQAESKSQLTVVKLREKGGYVHFVHNIQNTPHSFVLTLLEKLYKNLFVHDKYLSLCNFPS